MWYLPYSDFRNMLLVLLVLYHIDMYIKQTKQEKNWELTRSRSISVLLWLLRFNGETMNCNFQSVS